ncbi:unnamed protein product [Leuciscus chuanchicus]
MEGLKVEWRRTDTKALVHLYQDGESRAEVQQQDYHDRAHFFTDQIQHGNFSLLLENLRAEDEGKYACKVYRYQRQVFSINRNLELRLVGSPLVRRSVWFVLMLLVNAVMVYFYIIALENEKDHVGWASTIGFLQLLWAVINFTRSFDFALHRVVPVYLFGSVVVVLLNSVTVMAELILKTENGYGAVGDLRVVVFSSEFIFTLFLMTLLVFEPWIKTCVQLCQNAAGSDETPVNESSKNTAESQEMKPLLNKHQEASRSDVTEENQPDSVETQT